MNRKENRYKGYWWLSDDPDEKVPGISFIDMHKGADVELIGSLVSSEILFNGPLNALSGKNLIGETQQGLVTLVDVLIGSHKHHSASTISEGNYSSDVAIVGRSYFSTKDEVIFDSVEVDFTLFSEWIGKSGMKIEEDTDDNGSIRETRIIHNFPEVLESYIASIEACIKTNYRCLLNTSFGDKRLKHRSSLVIAPDTPQNFEWYSQKVESLRKLLMVLIGSSVSIYSMTGFRYDNESSDDRPSEFDIYIRTSQGLSEVSEMDMHRMLMRFSRTSSNFSSLLNAWFDKAEIITPAVTLYTYNLSAKFVYSEFRLVNYVQALETLDRRINGSENPNPKKRVKRLLRGVWEGCLDHFIHDRDRFVEEVSATRNYAVHFNSYEREKEYVVSGSGIFYLSERLKVLLITNILLQLDIPREEVYQAVLYFNSFDYLKLVHRPLEYEST